MADVGVLNRCVSLEAGIKTKRKQGPAPERDPHTYGFSAPSYATGYGQAAASEFDEELFSDLPPYADPCGENGELHSLVYASPMFRHNLLIEVNEVVSRDHFVFADLVVAEK